MTNEQKIDAMYLARELATLQAVLADEEGAWYNMTEHQRSAIRNAKRRGQEYIDKYAEPIKSAPPK